MRWTLSALCLLLLACGGSDDPTSTSSDMIVDPGSNGGGASNGPSALAPKGNVAVHLEKTVEGAARISFGVPVPPGALSAVASVAVTSGGQDLGACVTEILATHDADGNRTGVRSMLVQIDAARMPGPSLDVDVAWKGGTASPTCTPAPYAGNDVSVDSPMVVDTTVRTIASVNGTNQLVEAPHVAKTLFTGREPRVLATFPPGYLASTGLLGQQVSADTARAAGSEGMAFLSTALGDFAKSAMYEEGYALNPEPDSVIDPNAGYEGWLYDRCATFLTAYVHLGDAGLLRHADRSCSRFASQINTSGADRGIFAGKPERDTKYSHLRGLYAYYALTGDETALAAGQAIADMWLDEPYFVKPYRQGHVAGPDKLWTERLLATSLEGLYYGHRLTGDTKYLGAFRELFETAYRHITGDAATLAQINPGYSFPPQNCFVHSGVQHADAEAGSPWCSSWMSELLVDPLLRYQEQTGDPRVDEIFIRLGRFLRDVGTNYFTSDPLGDAFLAPSVCDDPAKGDSRRRLVPLYGAGVAPNGSRVTFGEWDDIEHCADATALTAAALRSLERTGQYDANPVGPFPSEGASILALHRELASCAKRTFAQQTRPLRAPSTWTSAALAAGLSDPAGFILENRIGYPVHVVSPQRKISWWFNTSMLDFGLLDEAGIALPTLTTGDVQPSSCPPPAP